ncbi:MAG: hypothetical protein EA377_08890 [Phycisphaerales bacterium]|nr:MAG: hypothetical protein EA377_08890 [Phycisphaerales bacterium]
MSESTESNKSASKRRRRWFMPLIVVVVVLCVLALAVLNALQPGNLAELRAEWEAAGGVDDLSKLMPEPIPDEENAAVIYRRILPEVAVATRTQEFNRTLDESPHDLDALNALLAPHEELLTELLEAAMMEQGHWGEDHYASPPDSMAMTMGWQMQMRDAARLMYADLLRQLARGDLEAAEQRFHATMNMASHAMQPTTILNVLVSLAIRTTALEALKESLQDQPRMIADSSWLDRPAPDELTRQMVLHEGAHSLPMIAAATGGAMRVLQGRNEAAYLDLMLQAYRQAETPFWQQDWSGAQIESSVFLTVADSVAPAINRAVEAIWLMEGRFLQLETAFELRRYHAEHGSYPETWETPTNPVTGQPIEYERTETGFRLRLQRQRAGDEPGGQDTPPENSDLILEWR